METVENTDEVRHLDETMDISFELQRHEQISEFSEALFPSHLQGGYHVNRV